MRTETAIKSINDLTRERMEEILTTNWPDLPSFFLGIESLSCVRVEQGVMSCVYRITVVYQWLQDHCVSISHANIPTEWIVKLPRGDLPLEWMFESETVMYQILPRIVLSGSKVPLFTIPRLLHGSKECIIVEGIQNVICHDIMAGTPAQNLTFVLKALASLHGATWKSELLASQTTSLKHPPGMGQRLSPLQKEFLFRKQWRGAVDRASNAEDGIANEIKKFTVDLCEQLECRRLRDVHNMVHYQQLCCVHGDYNISNFLFPANEDDQRKPVLIDWATAGYGNPMIDLAFFFIVNDGVAGDILVWLKQYHQDLILYIGDDGFSFNEMLNNFRWTILYQFMILVTYDCMNDRLAQGNTKQVKIKLKHFANVNRRAIEAMYFISGFEVNRLPILTELEQEQATAYSSINPLSV